jgi:hypothetical protein
MGTADCPICGRADETAFLRGGQLGIHGRAPGDRILFVLCLGKMIMLWQVAYGSPLLQERLVEAILEAPNKLLPAEINGPCHVAKKYYGWFPINGREEYAILEERGGYVEAQRLVSPYK